MAGLVRKILQRIHHAFENRLRRHHAPVGKHPDDLRSREFRDTERALGKPGLIFVRMLRIEDVLLKPGVDLGRVRERALQQRRGDGHHLQPVPAKHGHRGGDFVVAQVHDVPATHDAQFGALHTQFLHRGRGNADVGRKFVGDRADTKTLHSNGF